MMHLARVHAIFTHLSHDYRSASNHFPWSWLRQREGRSVSKMIGSLERITVLDLGAGAGQYSRVALSLGATRVIAVDLSEEMLRSLDHPNITTVAGDAASCQLNLSFKLILCAGLLEFCPDPAAVLANARKHATRDAKLVVLAPASTIGGYFYRQYHKRNGLSISTFTRDQLIRVARTAGWELEAWQFVWPFTYVSRFKVKA